MTASFSLLASPVTGEPLEEGEGGMRSADGTFYPIADGIVDLVDPRLADEAVEAESRLFDANPLHGLCYFRPRLFADVLAVVDPLLVRPPDRSLRCAELGGGEGFLASSILYRFGSGTAQAFVCDVSRGALSRADPRTVRVRCDVRHPCFAEGSLDLAAFWVSLHHFSVPEMARCLHQAARATAPGGLVVIFEPNQDFLPRRWLYRLPLRRLVYFDEEEKGVTYRGLREAAGSAGLHELAAVSVNPPYNPEFVAKFRLWPLFWAAVECFRGMDGFRQPFAGLSAVAARGAHGLVGGSYLFAVFRKEKP